MIYRSIISYAKIAVFLHAFPFVPHSNEVRYTNEVHYGNEVLPDFPAQKLKKRCLRSAGKIFIRNTDVFYACAFAST